MKRLLNQVHPHQLRVCRVDFELILKTLKRFKPGCVTA